MGRLKDRLIQEEEQGWYFTGKHVCTECFTDDAIKQLVSARLEHNRCDYCKCSGEEPMAAPLDDVLKMIGEGLAVEWGDAINELPYESAEGGYQG